MFEVRVETGRWGTQPSSAGVVKTHSMAASYTGLRCRPKTNWWGVWPSPAGVEMHSLTSHVNLVCWPEG
eukprot:865723-Pelagomonas_calceolata.AAC.2